MVDVFGSMSSCEIIKGGSMENDDIPRPHVKSSPAQLVKVACENARLNNYEQQKGKYLVNRL